MIGVVGGMGPYAGLDLVRKIFNETVAKSDQEHLPLALVSLSDRIGDRSEYLKGRSDENPAIKIFEAVERLYAAGATVAGMACVTAHSPSIYTELMTLLDRSGFEMRMLHIVEETIGHIRRRYSGLSEVGALSTTGTFQNGLFFSALERAGFNVVRQTEEEQQQLVHEAIFNRRFGIKAVSDPVDPEALRLVHEAVKRVRDRGARVVILGCTELPLAVSPGSVDGVELVDPARVLARSLIHATFPDKLRPHGS